MVPFYGSQRTDLTNGCIVNYQTLSIYPYVGIGRDIQQYLELLCKIVTFIHVSNGYYLNFYFHDYIRLVRLGKT